jgi:hypothetical protein
LDDSLADCVSFAVILALMATVAYARPARIDELAATIENDIQRDQGRRGFAAAIAPGD